MFFLQMLPNVPATSFYFEHDYVQHHPVGKYEENGGSGRHCRGTCGTGLEAVNNINLTQAFQHDHTRSKEQKVRSKIKDHCKISLDKI